MKKVPEVSVIVPCRNEEKRIKRCIDSILAQDYPADKIEIIIVDGMSNDGTRRIIGEYAERYANIRIMDNPDGITPKAFNIGTGNSKGEIITIISAHSAYAAGYLSKCVEYLGKTGADNVGGICDHRGEGFIGKAISLVLNVKFALGGAKFRTAKKEQYVDTVFPGAWPKETFQKYGYFSEQLLRNQDIEHNARIRKNGGRIFFTPEIRCYYYCRTNLKDLWLQNFRTGYWNIKTIIIAPHSLSLRHFVPLIFTLSLLTVWIVPKLWLFIITSYMLVDIFFSLKIALKNGVRYFFLSPIIFAVLHVSYGLGTLAGVLNLLISHGENNVRG